MRFQLNAACGVLMFLVAVLWTSPGAQLHPLDGLDTGVFGENTVVVVCPDSDTGFCD